MTIIQDIGGWLAQQPPWLSDCARRLLQQGTLGLGDKEDLVALVKVHHGFKDPKGRQPEPLDPAQIPAAAQAGVDVRLLALRTCLRSSTQQSQECQVDELQAGVERPLAVLP